MPWIFVLITALIAALVAAAGDRMGHRAARRKLRFGKMRPRHVSTIIAVATGVLISLATYGVMFLFWRDFREALSRYTEVKAGYEKFKADLETTQAELGKAKELSAAQSKELELKNQQAADLSNQIAGVEEQLKNTSLSLGEADALLRKKEALQRKLNAKLKEVQVEIERAQSESEAAKINRAAEEYRAGSAELIIPKDAFLTYERVETTDSGQLKSLLQRAVNRVNIRLSQRNLAISQESETAASEFLRSIEGSTGAPMVIIVKSARNMFSGEELLLAFESRPLGVIIPAGQLVMEITVEEESAKILMAGQDPLSLPLPRTFDQDSLVQFMLQSYDRFVLGMQALGFLPQAPSGEYLTPFDALAGKADDLAGRARPYRIQIVSKLNATAMDGLAACSIYISNPGQESAEASADIEPNGAEEQEGPEQN